MYCIAGERQGPVVEVNCAVAKLVVFRAEVTKELVETRTGVLPVVWS